MGISNKSEQHRDAIARAVVALCPHDLKPDVADKFREVATMLAQIGRLKPRFVDLIVEFSYVTIRLEKLRAIVPTLAGEVIETQGRYGRQIKIHPAVRLINATSREWLRLANMLGMTPRGEKALLGRRANMDFGPVAGDEFFRDSYR